MARDPNCVFCRIVAGDIPSLVVHEDESVFCFLDVGPLAEGHLLVIPKAHYEEITDMPPALCGAVAGVIPKLGSALVSVTEAAGFNVLQNNGKAAGQVVPHVHFHLIPRVSGDGLGYRWNAGTYPEGRAEALATAYRQALA